MAPPHVCAGAMAMAVALLQRGATVRRTDNGGWVVCHDDHTVGMFTTDAGNVLLGAGYLQPIQPISGMPTFHLARDRQQPGGIYWLPLIEGVAISYAVQEVRR